MGTDGGRRRWPPLAAALAVIALAAPGMGAEPAGAARKGTTIIKASQLAQSGHASFWNCPARTTDVLVAVNTLTLHPGATLNLTYSVRNGGTASCTYTAPFAGPPPTPTATALTAGPCGSLAFEIEDVHHHAVWPGAQIVNCPALGTASLAAGATVSGSGSWNQDKAGSTHRVAPGNYLLVVDNKRFSFPLRIARS